MLVIGYKVGANFKEAPKVIAKHTNISVSAAVELVKKIEQGEVVSLPNDFVLRDDLKDINFLIT